MAKEDLEKKEVRDNSINNIKHFVNLKDMKLGDFETKAGVRVGYLASINNNSSCTVPSTMFLKTASEILDVSIDNLINKDLTQLSKDEILIANFIEKLRSRSFKGLVSWKKQSLNDINKIVQSVNEPNPLVKITGGTNEAIECMYESKFEHKYSDDICIDDTIYFTSLDSDSEVWLIPISWKEVFDEKMSKGYELYVFSGTSKPKYIIERDNSVVDVEPVICTGDDEFFDEALEELYKTVELSFASNKLSSKARKILSNYTS